MNAALLITPEAFFKDRISDASQTLKMQIEEEVEFYLVNLLCEFIEPAKVNKSLGEINVLETPLALMLKEALEASPNHQIKLLKRLGDTSLYFAGFFQDYFNGKSFDIDYYIDMGAQAYVGLSSIMHSYHNDHHFSTIYKKLGEQFNDLVEVVAEVSTSTGPCNPSDLLNLYDKWIHNASQRAYRVLQRNGFNPVGNPTKQKQ